MHLREQDTLEIPPENKHRFTLEEVAIQVKNDLYSKSVDTGYTSTYGWLAGQFGHFAIGFVGLSIILLVWQMVWRTTFTGMYRLIPAVLIIVWFAGKEYRDYRNAAGDAADSGTFPFRKTDVARDAATAVWYFVMGVLLAQSLFPETQLAWIDLIYRGVAGLVGLSVSLVIGRWWLERKMSFQQAGLPVIFRLANFKSKVLDKDQLRRITEFTALRGGTRHLLITGPLKSGKTLLACAIGTEHAFHLGPARYFTLNGFLDTVKSGDDSKMTDLRRFWPWNQTNILIFDDIEASLFHDFALAPESEGIFKGLRERRTVWLLNQPGQKNEWLDMLRKVFDKQLLELIELTEIHREIRDKPAKIVAKGFD